MGYNGSEYKGDSSKMSEYAEEVKRFGVDLEQALDEIQSMINRFTENNDKDSEEAGINGESNDALFGTYNGLHAKLLEYVDEFKDCGTNVDNEAEGLSAMDNAYSDLHFSC